MRATIQNLSNRPRDHWVVVSFPTALCKDWLVESTFVTDDGRKWRACRGKSSNTVTRWRIRCIGIGANEKVSGKLINEKHLPADGYSFHPWIMDDLVALLPQMGVKRDGVEKWAVLTSGPELQDWSAAHQRWTVTQSIPEWGLHFTWFADLLHDDPVMHCWGKMIWSDRTDPNYNRRFENFAVRSGEMFLLDFAVRHGASIPVKDAEGRWVTILNNTFLTMQDGSGLPLSGVMIGSPSAKEAMWPENWESSEDPIVRYWGSIMAAVGGPLVAVCHEWDGHWLAHKNTPKFDPSYVSRRESEWEAFVQAQSVNGGWYALRPVGLGKTPSQTGDQEDFGATKGTYAVAELDPRWIRAYQYSVYAEMFRGVNLLEANGQPVLAGSHPQWVTWSGITHYHPGVSPDRLGKSSVSPAGNGWEGYDDEHRSQNNMAAYASLVDDPLMQEQAFAQLQVDRASYRSRFPHYGQGAARAQGRLVGAFAQLAFCTHGLTSSWFSDLISERMTQSLAIPSLNVPGPMKVLAWGGPDGRKQVYLPNGQLGPWTSMWEHALAVIGIYAAHKVVPLHEPTKEVLKRVCETLKQFSFFNYNNTWYTIDDMLWQDGQPPPGGLVFGSRHFTYNAGVQGVANWTVAGLLVAREVTGSNPSLDAYLSFATGGGRARDRRTAEWWAAVQ